MIFQLRVLICLLWVAGLVGCGGGEGSSIKWKGFWYDPDIRADRGTFQADLKTDGYRIWGSVQFTGFRVASIKVDGEVSEDYSGNNDTYTEVDFSSADGVTVSFLEFGTGLDDNTTMAGTLTDETLPKDYRIYTVSAECGMLSVASGFKADFSSLSSIAAANDGTLWAYGKHGESDLDRLYKLDSEGKVVDEDDLDPMGSLMTWGNDRLWFVTGELDNQTLSSYLTSDYTSDSQVALSDLDPWDRVNAITYVDEQVLAVTGMVVNKVQAVDPTTGSTISSWSGEYDDLHDLTTCGDLLVALQWDRTGYLEQLLVYDKSGNLQRYFVVPSYESNKLACDDSFLYTATFQGWVLKTPIAELSGS